MEDAIDEGAIERPPESHDSCSGQKLPNSSALLCDRKSAAARRRRLELRRLKLISTFCRPDSKRPSSALRAAARNTTVCDATQWTASVSELNCKRDISVVTSSISTLPVGDASPTAFGTLVPVRTGNEDKLADAVTECNETRAFFAPSKSSSIEDEEIRVSDRCQGITGTACMTNAAVLEEPRWIKVGGHSSKDNPSLNGLNDNRQSTACESSKYLDSEFSPCIGVSSEKRRNALESVVMRVGSLQKQAFELRRHKGLGLDEGESWTVESSTVSSHHPVSSTVGPQIDISLPSVAVVSPDSKAWEPCTGVQTIRGRRKEMEDAVTVAHRFLSLPCELTGRCTATRGAEFTRSWRHKSDDSLHFFGVYDGHGGAQVADHCSKRLHQALAEEVRVQINADRHSPAGTSSSRNGTGNTAECLKEFWARAMSETFLRMDQEVGGLYRISCNGGLDDGRSLCPSEVAAPETAGSTAVAALVSECLVIIANCGDSRAVLSRAGQAIALSVDHKPDRGDEMARIEAAGGTVMFWNGYRVFGMLAMSRAIGDRFLKPFVISDPEVTCTERCKEDECLILASDGLWDVMSNDEACAIARSCMEGEGGAQLAANCLANAAHQKGSGDNITVVVVDLRKSRIAPSSPRPT